MLENPPALAAFIAYLLICVRLLTYRRGRARHRHGVAWIAWMLVVVSGWSAFQALAHEAGISTVEALRAALLCLFVFGVRGNVARLLRGAR